MSLLYVLLCDSSLVTQSSTHQPQQLLALLISSETPMVCGPLGQKHCSRKFKVMKTNWQQHQVLSLLPGQRTPCNLPWSHRAGADHGLEKPSAAEHLALYLHGHIYTTDTGEITQPYNMPGWF